MEIKTGVRDILRQNTNMDRVLPSINNFSDHFQLADKLELTPITLFDHTEKSWKEIENFEFQKMDIKASFEQLIKRI